MFGDDAAGSARVRVKICGITNARDAEAAIEAGADALGFNGYAKSKRYLNLRSAAEWIEKLPSHVTRIAVLVNPNLEEAKAIARLSGFDGLQLHGNETAEFCASLTRDNIPFAKAIPASEPGRIKEARSFGTHAIVLDSGGGDSFGGTGTVFPWEIARTFRQSHPDLRVILAGGLTPENVARAVAEVWPYAVDVTTGVESSPGRKDAHKLREFLKAARSVSF